MITTKGGFKFRLEKWNGDALLFQIIAMPVDFVHKKFVTSKGFEIISHPQVAPILGGKRVYVRNNIKEHDYNICVLYFKDGDSRYKYAELLIDSLCECFDEKAKI